MTRIRRSSWFLLIGIGAAASTARASEGPLLVAVEVAPRVDVAPDDVRQVVARELGTPVVGWREPSAAAALDVLFVAIDTNDLRMSLRAGGAAVVSRTISTPPDRAGRMRSIGWLAGNLVRDQVGPILGAGEAAPPATVSHPATEPPALAETTPRDAAAPEAVVARRPASGGDEPAHSAWAITVAGGPTLQMLVWGPDFPGTLSGGGVYQIEVQHQASPDSLPLGVALEVGPSGEGATSHYLGVAGFLGSRRGSGRWFIEGTVGLGVEVVSGRVQTLTVTNNSQTGVTSESQVSFEPVPALYARLQGTGGVQVSQMFDLVAQIGAHPSSSWKFGSYLSSTFGVRLRLP
jgi:hypothetical protein